MTWFNSNYIYKKQIIQDHTKVVTSSQLNFNVRISMTDANLKTVANGGRVQNSSGFDIIFTNSSETTQLDHEIEKYVSTTGEIEMWVRFPSISNLADTTIYMYYGNASISTSQENINGVWDSNYKAVWHLKEATGTNAAESTSSGNTATQSNSPTQSTGQIDGALSFNGSTQQLATSTTPTGINFNRTNPFTISFWAKPTSGQTGVMSPITHRSGSGQPGYAVSINQNDSAGNVAGDVTLLISSGANHLSVFTTSPTAINNGSWHKYDVTYDGFSAPSGVKIYQDGVSLSLSTAINTLSGTTSATVAFIIGGSSYNGLLDEVRVSNVVRSAAWLATEYNSQSSPSTFYSVGSEIVQPVALSVTFAGAGVLTATTSLSTALAVNFAGQSDLAATLSAPIALAVTFAGQATLSATPSLTTSLSSTFAGTGVLTAALSAQMDLGSATFAGQGSLTATPSLTTALATSLDGQGVLTATLAAAMTLSVEFDGTSALTASPSLGVNLATTLAGIGALDTSGMELSTALSVEFDGTGELNGTLTASNTVSLAVTMEGQGSLAGTLSLATDLAISFNGIGVLTASPSLSTALTATLDGIGTLTATPELSTSLTASFDGSGVLTATPELATSLAVTMAGQSDLTATLLAGSTANLAVTMAGQGSLTASADFTLALAAVSLDGSSSLTGNIALGASLATTMTGQGDLSGAMSLSVALTTTLAGNSSLSGALTLPVALAVVFAAHGVLLASLSGGAPIPLSPNVTAYVRSGYATFAVRDGTVAACVREGNATFYTRGE